MVDQINLWGSVLLIDSVVQVVDVWGGVFIVVLVNGGGVDWLYSVLVLQLEQFNIMDLFYKILILFDSWVIYVIDWIVLYFCLLFQGICVLIDYIFSVFQQLLLGILVLVVIIVFVLIVWQIFSFGMGVVILVLLIVIGVIGVWL